MPKTKKNRPPVKLVVWVDINDGRGSSQERTIEIPASDLDGVSPEMRERLLGEIARGEVDQMISYGWREE